MSWYARKMEVWHVDDESHVRSCFVRAMLKFIPPEKQEPTEVAIRSGEIDLEEESGLRAIEELFANEGFIKLRLFRSHTAILNELERGSKQDVILADVVGQHDLALGGAYTYLLANNDVGIKAYSFGKLTNIAEGLHPRLRKDGAWMVRCILKKVVGAKYIDDIVVEDVEETKEDFFRQVIADLLWKRAEVIVNSGEASLAPMVLLQPDLEKVLSESKVHAVAAFLTENCRALVAYDDTAKQVGLLDLPLSGAYKLDQDCNLRFSSILSSQDRCWCFKYLFPNITVQLLGALRSSEDLISTTKNCLEGLNDYARPFHGMLGISSAWRKLVQDIITVAHSEQDVLICGESGTGKEDTAKAIYLESSRSDGPLIPVSCPEIVDTLAESLLFGRVKGVHTGAQNDTPGYFRAANKGTIFLDEISELPPELQPKLLRVLQTRKVMPVGAKKAVPIDVRVICTTNKDLSVEVEKGTFRPDLYYRIKQLQIQVPSLAERREDIPVLARHFYKKALEKEQATVANENEFVHELYKLKERRLWPNNIRELQNDVNRAVACSKSLRSHELDPQRFRSFLQAPSSTTKLNVGMNAHALFDRVRAGQCFHWKALKDYYGWITAILVVKLFLDEYPTITGKEFDRILKRHLGVTWNYLVGVFHRARIDSEKVRQASFDGLHATIEAWFAAGRPPEIKEKKQESYEWAT